LVLWNLDESKKSAITTHAGGASSSGRQLRPRADLSQPVQARTKAFSPAPDRPDPVLRN
jgi:hypothetical protein